MTLKIAIFDHIASISAQAWDSLTAGDPFISHAWFSALENSGSIGNETGWQPLYLAATKGSDLLGVAPLFVKYHSYGEYIFDHVFADAYARHGRDYYPKLLCASPFTPVQGQRIITPHEDVFNALTNAIVHLTAENQLSSAHINFSQGFAPSQPWMERHSVQYHFDASPYHDFDDFLAALSSSKRKMIKKERSAAHSHGLDIQMVEGGDLGQAEWDCFWACYQDTGARKWGTPYLTRKFFDEIAQTLSKDIVMGVAYAGKSPVATALHFKDGHRLLGRYWGVLGDYKFLHLELCYYQAIDYAIAKKIPSIEAGAQGEHKLARGYRPTCTKSFHYFDDPQFAKAILDFLTAERSDMLYYIKRASESLPFRE